MRRIVSRARRRAGLESLVCVLFLVVGHAFLSPPAAFPETFTIFTPGGPVQVVLRHVGPEGSLASPEQPAPPVFRPPSIFSAPLPSGSGARALGQAGAFTAVADDATAASWNPAGLIQLERPELSVMLRYSRHRGRHYSDDEEYRVGSDHFENANLNYFSAAMPFRIMDRHAVFALNYQEAYDFEQRFRAENLRADGRSVQNVERRTFSDVQVDHADDGRLDLTVTTRLTTYVNSRLESLLASDLVTDFEFKQEGIIDAVSPAWAFEITPKLSVGFALNFYQDDLLGYRPITSRTRAKYSGSSRALGDVTDVRTTDATYEYEGTWTVVVTIPPGIVVTSVVPISGSGPFPRFSDTETQGIANDVSYEGEYEERNEFSGLEGWNATFGALWTVGARLTLGASVDLPWTARATQKKHIRQRLLTLDGSGTRVMEVTEQMESLRKDVEFRFPLYWAVGAVWKWNNVLSSSLDINRTHWSSFSYQAEAEERLNPLDGTRHGENPLDDCWAVRLGSEYIRALRHTEIPFRCGFSWEQRPAVGEPDVFYGVSLGSGISIGKDPGKWILDVAYNYSWGDNVLGSLVQGQQGLSTDMQEHQVYVSCIYHF